MNRIALLTIALVLAAVEVADAASCPPLERAKKLGEEVEAGILKLASEGDCSYVPRVISAMKSKNEATEEAVKVCKDLVMTKRGRTDWANLETTLKNQCEKRRQEVAKRPLQEKGACPSDPSTCIVATEVSRALTVRFKIKNVCSVPVAFKYDACATKSCPEPSTMAKKSESFVLYGGKVPTISDARCISR